MAQCTLNSRRSAELGPTSRALVAWSTHACHLFDLDALCADALAAAATVKELAYKQGDSAIIDDGSEQVAYQLFRLRITLALPIRLELRLRFLKVSFLGQYLGFLQMSLWTYM